MPYRFFRKKRSPSAQHIEIDLEQGIGMRVDQPAVIHTPRTPRTSRHSRLPFSERNESINDPRAFSPAVIMPHPYASTSRPPEVPPLRLPAHFPPPVIGITEPNVTPLPTVHRSEAHRNVRILSLPPLPPLPPENFSPATPMTDTRRPLTGNQTGADSFRIPIVSRGNAAATDMDESDDPDNQRAPLIRQQSHPAAHVARQAIARHLEINSDNNCRGNQQKIDEITKKAEVHIKERKLSKFDREVITEVTIFQLGIGAITELIGGSTSLIIGSCVSFTALMFLVGLAYCGLPLIHHQSELRWYKRPIFVIGSFYLVLSTLTFILNFIPLLLGKYSRFLVYNEGGVDKEHEPAFDTLATVFCLLTAATPMLVRPLLKTITQHLSNEYLAELKNDVIDLQQRLASCQQQGEQSNLSTRRLLLLLRDANDQQDADFSSKIDEIRRIVEHEHHAHGCAAGAVHADGECTYRPARTSG